MNESELEEQLRRLKPVAPSAGLLDAIARELTHSPAIAAPSVVPAAHETESAFTSVLRGLPWAIGGAAAAVIAMAAMEPPQDTMVADAKPLRVESQAPVAPTEGEFQAEGPSREILHAVQGGVILADQEEPSRLVRVNSLERRTWSNPQTGAQIAVELPREDLLLVPVAYQ